MTASSEAKEDAAVTPTEALARALADWRSRPAEPMPWDTEDAEGIIAALAALGYEVRPIEDPSEFWRGVEAGRDGIEQAAEACPPLNDVATPSAAAAAALRERP